MRITKEHLENQVEILNEFTNQPKKPWSKDKEGKFLGNIGNYHISQAYGGFKLEQIANQHGGVREMTNYRLTKRELYYVLHCINNVLRQEKKEGKRWNTQLF